MYWLHFLQVVYYCVNENLMLVSEIVVLILLTNEMRVLDSVFLVFLLVKAARC